MKLYGLLKKKNGDGVVFKSEEDRETALTGESRYYESMNLWGANSLAYDFFENFIEDEDPEGLEEQFQRFEIEVEVNQ